MLLAIIVMVGPGAARNDALVGLGRLRCEMLEDPVGIDVTQPRLSWMITGDVRNIGQTAYQVLVSSSAEKLQQGTGDLWNSGKIISNQSIHIAYKGKPLTSRVDCF